jgi:diaminopimelate epimerase
VVVALASLGRTSRRVRVDVPGGTLLIEWSDTTNRVRMRGPATFVFEGQFSPQDPTDSRTP